MIVTNPHSEFRHHVVSLGDLGQLGAGLLQDGVPITLLEARGIGDAPRTVLRLFAAAGKIRPDVIHGWLYHGIAAAALLKVRRTPTLGAIHATRLEAHRLPLGTRAAMAVTKWGLKACDEIVFCSASALDHHARSGFPVGRRTVIENGIDLARFADGGLPREEARRGLGLPGEGMLIGMAARFDPQKDHGTLFAALRRIRDAGVAARLVLAGTGMDAGNAPLRALIAQHLDPGDAILLGYRRDMPEFYRALDVAVLSSAYGEAWPLTLVEAMAMQCPVIATDVGDAATILHGAGWLVPPRAPEALAASILEVLDAPAERLAPRLAAGRARVEAEYSAEAMLAKYEALYRGLAEPGR
jgi:glycosyltransferase involved in cell wall biosynthesis